MCTVWLVCFVAGLVVVVGGRLLVLWLDLKLLVTCTYECVLDTACEVRGLRRRGDGSLFTMG